MTVRLSIITTPETASVSASAEECSYAFDVDRIALGRGAAADIRLPHRSVSHQHAVIRVDDREQRIEDSGSTNGTYVNGERVGADRGKRLHDGDLISVGGYVMSFHVGRTTAPVVTAERTAELAKRLLRNQRAAVGVALAEPRLVVLNGPQTGASLVIGGPPARVLVGRGESCQLQLSDASVSREHMEVVRDLQGVQVRNLSSEGGILWGDHQVHERRLRDGDELVLGATRLLFEDPAEEQLKGLVHEPDISQPPPALPPPPAQPQAPEPVVVAPPPAVVRGRSRGLGAPSAADMVIYSFAAAVLALSIAGLLILLRAE